MELLVAKSLTLLLQGSALFADVDLVLRRGERIGLVGGNGAGKSTLLALLAGERLPDEGRVLRAPGVRIARVGQELPPPHLSVRELVARSQRRLGELEAALRAEERRLAAGEERLEAYGRLLEEFESVGGYRAESEARAALEALSLPESEWDRPVDTLSGGEQRRLRLALALAERPDVLLIDEPTNHLDLPRRRALAERLSRFAGGLLLVSHDRALLDGVCTHIALLERGRLRRYRGDFRAFERRRAQSRAREERRERARIKEQERVAETVAQLRSIGTAAAARRRRRFERRLDDLQATAATEPGVAAVRALPATPRAARGTLLRAEHLSRRQGDREVIDDAAVAVHAGDRVALIGANGSGKSTLLALLAGELPSDDPRARLRYGEGVRLAFADQRWRGLAPAESPLAALERLVAGTRARHLLAEAGLPPERWQAAAQALSGGERARAGLAWIAASEANLLLLDEPANDLDLDGIEQLERTLLAGGATVIFTSHDQRLIERVATRVWALEDGVPIEYRGGFAGYLAGARRLEPDPTEPAPSAQEEPPAAIAADPADDPAAPLEDELREIEEALSDPLRLGERARGRLERRRRALIETLAELYDERLPPPPPRFAARERGLEVRADLWASGRGAGLDLHSPLPLAIEVRVVGDVAHLGLRPRSDLCLLDWALSATLTACARLCLYLLPVRAVQLQSERDLSATPFAAAGHDWWLLSRSELERREGWHRDETRAP